MSATKAIDSAAVEAAQEFKRANALWRRASVAVERLEASRRFDESLRLARMEQEAQRMFRDEALRCLQAAEKRREGEGINDRSKNAMKLNPIRFMDSGQRLVEADRRYTELLQRAKDAQRPVSEAAIPACLAALGDLEARILEIRGFLKPAREV